MKKLLLISLIAVSAVFFYVATDVEAQSNSGIAISPTQNIVSLKPGESTKVTIKISNIDAKSKNIKSIFNNFTDNNDGTGTPKIIIDNQPGQSWEWLSGASSTRIAAEQTLDYEITINAPSDAKDGSYYTVARFSEDSSNSLAATIASMIIINVGNVQEKTEIEEFKFDKDTSAFIAKIKNTGNSFSKPNLMIEITDKTDNSKIGEYDMNPSSGGIINSGYRVFKVEQSYNFDPTKNYTAKLIMKTGTPEQTQTKELLLNATSQQKAENQTTKDTGKLTMYGISVGILFVILGILLAIFKLKKQKNKKPNIDQDLIFRQ